MTPLSAQHRRYRQAVRLTSATRLVTLCGLPVAALYGSVGIIQVQGICVALFALAVAEMYCQRKADQMTAQMLGRSAAETTCPSDKPSLPPGRIIREGHDEPRLMEK